MKKATKFSRRKLPHILSAGSIYFVTSNLKGTIPKSVLKSLSEDYHQKVNELIIAKPKNYKSKISLIQRLYFLKYDKYLDMALNGPTFLAQKEIAEILKEQFHRFDGKYYSLLAYTIMCNHFHLLIDTSIIINDANPTS